MMHGHYVGWILARMRCVATCLLADGGDISDVFLWRGGRCLILASWPGIFGRPADDDGKNAARRQWCRWHAEAWEAERWEEVVLLAVVL